MIRLHPRLSASVFAVMFLAWGTSAPVGRTQEFKAPAQKLQLADGDGLVFLGDSITHQCLYTQYVEDYFYTRFPQMRVKFHNAGVGGARAWDALQRFDRDVASYHPKYVTILLGMNDGGYQPFDKKTFETYRTDMLELIGRIESSGAKPVLMTPTMFDSRAARLRAEANEKLKRQDEVLAQYNSVLAYYGAWLRDVAVEQGYGFVDMYGPLNRLTLKSRASKPRFTMIADAVHPDAPGQLIMAYALISDLGLPTTVSQIRVRRTADGTFQHHEEGGTLSDLKSSDRKVEFTWQAANLPWAVPPEAALGAELAHLDSHMNRETFELHGLAPGKHELRIDGELVGTFTSHDLSKGIEMQNIHETPQYKQALRVAELNKKRNGGPVKSLRNEWNVFQQHSQLKRTLAEKGDNEKVAEQVSKFEEKLKGIEERIADQEDKAKKAEDEIFKANQPPARHYEVIRVE